MGDDEVRHSPETAAMWRRLATEAEAEIAELLKRARTAEAARAAAEASRCELDQRRCRIAAKLASTQRSLNVSRALADRHEADASTWRNRAIKQRDAAVALKARVDAAEAKVALLEAHLDRLLWADEPKENER